MEVLKMKEFIDKSMQKQKQSAVDQIKIDFNYATLREKKAYTHIFLYLHIHLK